MLARRSDHDVEAAAASSAIVKLAYFSSLAVNAAGGLIECEHWLRQGQALQLGHCIVNAPVLALDFGATSYSRGYS